MLEKIYKKVLANGLTVLVVPRHELPKVSVQLWYNVGSKDEKSHEKGIAHLIEHMIFKGTKALSESDINMITHKLSGYCNAFTSHDYTGYLFDMPSQHWYEALPIMADCMVNCTFKPDLLSSELKAVIQELKMYNDDYSATLIEKMLGVIFDAHPYRYPIIGYKDDLRAATQESLLAFYRTHYVPNNATLVVVGDVDLEDVYHRAEQQFGHLPSSPLYAKSLGSHEVSSYAPDILSTSVVLYRDVQQPNAFVAWVIPGMKAGKDYLFDLMSWVIGAGKGSRLYNVIVNQRDLATDIESFVYDFFDHGLFFVQFQPVDGVSVETVIEAIQEEIARIVAEGIGAEELERAVKKTGMDFLALQENNQKMAYVIGKYYVALGDEQYISNYQNFSGDKIKEIQNIITEFLRPSVMHRGLLLPLAEEEKQHWLKQQERSDKEDMVFDAVRRETEIEPGVYVNTVVAQAPKEFNFPQPEEFILSNGLRVLHHYHPGIPKIDLILDFKAKHYYDPLEKQGLSVFLYDMLQEGTEQYSSEEFTHLVERHGMSLNTFPGHVTMSMLSADSHTGLALLAEMVMRPAFNAEKIEQVRTRILTDVVDFWDTPTQFASQLMREALYEGHPYSKRLMGSVDSMRSITRADIMDAYRSWITPSESRLAVVGDIRSAELQELLETTLGKWQGPHVADIAFPHLSSLGLETVGQHSSLRSIKHYINRDQTTVCFGNISVDRANADFDKLLLFDQVFTGGIGGSMNSRLFALRERSGLFYTIGGSLLAGSGKQPGILFVKTLVSNDRLVEAEQQIKGVIDQGARGLTQEEHEEAQRVVINSLVDNFAHNGQTATTFLFLDMFNLPADYFNHRVAALQAITREDVQNSAAKLLDSNRLISLRVGRV